MQYRGGCHCGNIAITFETERLPTDMPVRACQCSFCRKHNTRTCADPDGRADIRIAEPDELSRYTFGFAAAEFLVCRNCGVYVAALTRTEPPRALVVVNCLDDHEKFTMPAVATRHDHETPQERIARRSKTWTPATVR